MADRRALRQPRVWPEHEAVSLLKDAAEDLPAPEHADAFGEPFERFGDATVVLLGEASHGTSEFYRARAAISRHLIRNCGFNIIAVESDWPDAARIDRYVRHHPPEPSREAAFARFPELDVAQRRGAGIRRLAARREHAPGRRQIGWSSAVWTSTAFRPPSRRCCSISTA